MYQEQQHQLCFYDRFCVFSWMFWAHLTINLSLTFVCMELSSAPPWFFFTLSCIIVKCPPTTNGNSPASIKNMLTKNQHGWLNGVPRGIDFRCSGKTRMRRAYCADLALIPTNNSSITSVPAAIFSEDDSRNGWLTWIAVQLSECGNKPIAD